MKKVNNKETSLTCNLHSQNLPSLTGDGSGERLTIICHDIVALEEALKKGVVHMVYLKKNGAMRDAHGTRASALIPEGYRAQGRRKASPRVLTYWDTDRGGWRCLLRDRLMGWVESEK